MRVACIQMNSGADISDNLEQALYWLQQAAGQGCRLAVLPENFSFMGADDGARLAAAESPAESRALAFLAREAARLDMAIIGGSVALRAGEGRIRNSCAAFDRQGRCLDIYDKIHLFDVEVDGDVYHESALVRAGRRPCVVETDGWRIGLSICYDLRFPELYRACVARDCRILSVVAAFTVPTGRAHWQTLIRARAIENQCYVLASAQWGRHPGDRHTWGHSMIVDPWGTVLAQADDGTGLVTAGLSMQTQQEVRMRLPALTHRRLADDHRQEDSGESG